MSRSIRTGALAIAIVFLTAVASCAASARTTVLPAPIPTPLTAAKKAFVANGVDQAGFPAADGIFNDFYAKLQRWGRYELVTSPAEADIILQISVRAPYVYYVNNLVNLTQLEFQLQARDPKSNVLIWTTSVTPRGAGSSSGARKSYADTNTKLIDLFASQIGTAPLPKPAPNPKKPSRPPPVLFPH
jgi:hypothetical protein